MVPDSKAIGWAVTELRHRVLTSGILYHCNSLSGSTAASSAFAASAGGSAPVLWPSTMRSKW